MMLLKKDIPRKSTSKTFPGSHPGLQQVHIVVFPGDPESFACAVSAVSKLECCSSELMANIQKDLGFGKILDG